MTGNVLQTFETTILNATGSLGLKALVVPGRSSALPASAGSEVCGVEAVAQALNVSSPQVIGIADLIATVEALLKTDPGDAADEQSIKNFAAYVTCARLIPFESSPLGAESLAGIASGSIKLGTIGIGTTLGYVGAAGHPAMLFISVPLGIILCGTAVSFSKWVEENREQIWSKLLGLTPRTQAQPVGAAAPRAATAHG